MYRHLEEVLKEADSFPGLERYSAGRGLAGIPGGNE